MFLLLYHILSQLILVFMLQLIVQCYYSDTAFSDIFSILKLKIIRTERAFSIKFFIIFCRNK